jgi:hypothetical protein
MGIKIKQEVKTWMMFFAVILISAFLHEIGHCIPAWINGYKAVPTPAMEYVSEDISAGLKQYVSLGGILSTIILVIFAALLYIFNSNKQTSIMLAGALSLPGIYTLRFLMLGRGHDASEFQEAQAAMGFSYSGHAIDWIFLLLFISVAFTWFIKSKPSYKIIGRLLLGALLAFCFIVILQEVNNAVFNPLFG